MESAAEISARVQREPDDYVRLARTKRTYVDVSAYVYIRTGAVSLRENITVHNLTVHHSNTARYNSGNMYWILSLSLSLWRARDDVAPPVQTTLRVIYTYIYIFIYKYIQAWLAILRGVFTESNFPRFSSP